MREQKLSPCGRAAVIDTLKNKLEVIVAVMIGNGGLNLDDMTVAGVER